jgi:hypothetical protein
MANGEHDWLTVHRVRFRDALNGNGNPLPGPSGADAWRFYPDSGSGPDGLRTNISDIWGGLGIYASELAARAVFEAPADHLPYLVDAVESWHALVVPYAHRGEVNWRGLVQDGTALNVGDDLGGPLLILTSAGYDNPGPDDLPRIREFVRGVDDVVAFYATLPSNVRRAVFSGARVDGHDGATLSLWSDDPSMLAAAYHPGIHRERMDRQKKTGMFDRSSFTRGRILGSRGSWDGVDPVALMV